MAVSYPFFFEVLIKFYVKMKRAAKSIISLANRKKRELHQQSICSVVVTRHVSIDGNERFRVWFSLEFDL